MNSSTAAASVAGARRRDRSVLMAVAAISGLFSISCATVLSGSSKPVTFTSSPPGAAVVVVSFDETRAYQVKTPHTVDLERDKNYVAMFELSEHHVQTVPVASAAGGVTAGAAIGNLIAGGIILGPLFMMVDAGTGAAFTLPDRVHLILTPIAQVAPPNSFTYEAALAKIREKVAHRQEGIDRREIGRMRNPVGRKTKTVSANTVDLTVVFEELSTLPPTSLAKEQQKCRSAHDRRARSGARAGGSEKNCTMR